jgi:uncharacterized protein with HEPN domain
MTQPPPGDSPAKDDAYWVAQCHAIIRQATAIAARGWATFFDPANPVEFGAARMLVIDLDGAASHLSQEFRDSIINVPWSALARTRDKFAHHYQTINRDVVWELITRRLPEIAHALQNGDQRPTKSAGLD